MKTIALPSAPLFVPGNKPALFAKAAQSGADAVILDLEDAVAPDAKALARESVCNHGLSGIPVIVRINASGTPWHLDDLAALARADIAGEPQRNHKRLISLNFFFGLALKALNQKKNRHRSS
ncbi:MAG: hypothetical protein EBU34_04760 [Alphaproteobacteria bacterium]|nr:hypothetical protein [Alphaproteobacteria bacterium]